MSMCVQLRLTGIPVLVVGGGQSAYRKCCQLTQEGADIRVIAKRFDPALRMLHFHVLWMNIVRSCCRE